MMRKYYLGCFLLFPMTALGQSGSLVADKEYTSMGMAMQSAPTTVDTLTPRNTVEIRGGSEKEEASIQIGIKNGTKQTWNFTFTTPIDKEKKEGRFATLDGLSDSIRLKTSFNYFFPVSEKYQRDQDGVYNTCFEAAKLFGWNDEETYAEKIYGEEKCEDIVNPESADDESLYNKDRQQVTFTKELASLNKEKLKEIRKRYIRAGIGYRDATKTKGTSFVSMFKSDFTIGSEDFKYLENDLTTKKDDSEVEWAIGLGWRWVNVVDRYAIGVGYRREKIYDPSDKATLCMDSTVSGIQTCKTNVIGAPIDKDKNLAVINYDLLRNRWALSSIFTYDFEEDEYGIEIPVYFIRNKDSAWNGGVSFGWTNKEKDLTAQIFIGVPFEGFN